MFPAEHDDFERECIAKLERARRAQMSQWALFREDFPKYAKAGALPCLVIAATIFYSFTRTETVGDHPSAIEIGQASVIAP